jgi:hypothetical protein
VDPSESSASFVSTAIPYVNGTPMAANKNVIPLVLVPIILEMSTSRTKLLPGTNVTMGMRPTTAATSPNPAMAPNPSLRRFLKESGSPRSADDCRPIRDSRRAP